MSIGLIIDMLMPLLLMIAFIAAGSA